MPIEMAKIFGGWDNVDIKEIEKYVKVIIPNIEKALSTETDKNKLVELGN